MQQYLVATEYFDYHDPKIVNLFKQINLGTPKSMAVEIYYLVRDNYLYNPYRFVDGKKSFKASYCCQTSEGYCIPKASLMIALCRKAGIPARLGLADVLNHLATPKLLEMLGTNIFSMHGYVDLYIDGKYFRFLEQAQKLPLNYFQKQLDRDLLLDMQFYF